jgi:hypothetical protein
MSCSAAYELAERTTRPLVNAHKASLSIAQKVSALALGESRCWRWSARSAGGEARAVLPRSPTPRTPIAPKVKRYGRGCYAPARVPQPPKPRHIAQTVNVRGSAYATRCTLQPLVARQCRGRGFGLASTADVLLTKPSIRTSRFSRFYGICRKNKGPTSGLEPLTPAPATSLLAYVLARTSASGNCAYLAGFR